MKETIVIEFKRGQMKTVDRVSDKHLDDAVRELMRIQTERRTAKRQQPFGYKLRRFLRRCNDSVRRDIDRCCTYIVGSEAAAETPYYMRVRR